MSKVNLFKRAGRVGLLCACMTGFVGQAHAANWLMLQGVENPKLPPQRLFAFVQPTYFHYQGEDLSGLTGPFAGNNGSLLTANTVPPKFNDGSRLDIQRARLGSRGRFTGAFGNSFTKKMNYFFLVEMAPNLLTYNAFNPNRARVVALDHASLTFNHIPGARIRVGLFKNPTSEELFQGIQTFNYISFTDFSARENLERFFKGANKPALSFTGSPSLGTATAGAYGFSGVRDWGVQVFDSFKRGKWDLSYAVKVGRGEAISQPDDTDNNKELYLYASAEYNLPGGKGPYKNGVKLFGWHQSGKRKFRTDTAGQEFNRRRYGIGVSALGKFFGFSHKQRFGAELMFAEGMLFLSPTGGVAVNPGATLPNAGTAQIAADDNNKSRAITLDYGYYLNRKWHFDVRYDRHELLYKRSADINPGNERTFTNWTLGATYNFTPKARMTFNYTFRNADAPNAYTTGAGVSAGQAALVTSNVRTLVDNLDDLYALQFTYIF